MFLTCSVDEDASRSSFLFFDILQVIFCLVHTSVAQTRKLFIVFADNTFNKCVCVCVCTYVRKSLTSSTVSSAVESRVRSAQLRGESSGVSRIGEDKQLGGSSVCPARDKSRDSSTSDRE